MTTKEYQKIRREVILNSKTSFICNFVARLHYVLDNIEFRIENGMILDSERDRYMRMFDKKVQ